MVLIEILDYEKKGSAVYYSIEIMANAAKKWTITRKFKDIEEMHKKLIKKLSNMPYLPAKSIFSLGEDDLDKRRDDLEKYLNVLASRKDTLSDPEFKGFLELESHIKTETLTVVKELYEIPNLPMGVKDFVYIPSKGVLFVLLAETRIVSKIGSFLSSISKSQEVSSVIAYKEESEGSFEFTKLWQYNLSNEGSMLTWDHGLTILAIGHVNGLIECIRVSTELEYSRYTSFCKVHCHTQTITGILLLPETGHLLSSSLDKYLVKTDIANNEAHLAEKEHPQALTAMIMDKSSGRFFVADAVGTVFVYSAEGQMRCLATIAYHQENFIKTLFFDKQRSLLVAGSNQGNIVVYDIGKPGREKFSTYTTSFETVKQIRGLHFVGKNKELYVATATGTVAFMNSLTTIAFHMLDAHSGEISKMVYFENDKLMVTGSADRSIKFWRYPFDPNEKIQPKKVHAPKVAKYDYPELKANNAKAQSDEEYQSEEEEEEERDSREALTLFQYRPAKEPVFEDSEGSEDENFKESVAKTNQKPVQQVKEEEPESDEELPKEEKKKAPKIRKRPEHPLALAEPDEESDEEVPQKAAEASPKSFLFKNSVIEVVSKKDIKDLEKKAKVGGKPKEGKEKEPEIKVAKAETDDPLSRSLKPAPKQGTVVKTQGKQETEAKAKSDKETKSEKETKTKSEKEVKKVEEKEKKEEAVPEKKKEEVAAEDSKEKPSSSAAKVEEKGEKEEKEPAPKKNEEKEPVPKKREEEKASDVKKEEKKTSDKKPPVAAVAQTKVIADDPLSFPGPIVKKKTPSASTAKPKPQQKAIINESDSNILHIPTQPAKKKVVRKSLMDSDSDDDNLLDFQGLRSGAQTKGSKTSTKKKQQDSDEDEGLAGWAS